MLITARRAPLAMSALLGIAALAAAGCRDAEQGAPRPGPNPGQRVREAALKTLGAGPASIKLTVASASAFYSVRGAVEVAADRFRVRADVERAPMTHFDPVIEVIGLGAGTYLALRRAL